MPIGHTNVKVVVRVRPYSRAEYEQNQKCIIKVMDQTTLLFDPDEEDDEFFYHGIKQNYRDITKRVHKKLSMEFDRVFDPETNNQQIFEECTAPLVDSVLNGYNCSVFVYGATGAGKTFTMLGNESCAGLTFLTMRDLFEKIEAQSETRKFTVAVSYLEVYNEQVMNLLTKNGPLKLREDNSGVVVSGLIPKAIHTAEELLELLKRGNENRTQHPTDANAESSRSHAVFQVHIRITDRKTDIKRTVKLSMIDLAGSERAASTKGIGLRFREGANINKSLLALGNCINKLADGLKHIPYRDSNLTRILKDSLGGNCQTLMVANVSMSSLTFEDTYNTLKYASRAKKIRTICRQNAIKTNMPKEFYIKKVDELIAEIESLKKTQKEFESKIGSSQTSADEIELKNWYRKIDSAYSDVNMIQDNILGLPNQSQNYILNLKEFGENYRNILSLQQTLLKEDIENIKTTMHRIGKQIEQHIEEQTLWHKKLQDSYVEWNKLKNNIKESKYFDILKYYQLYKDFDVQLKNQNIKTTHIGRINNEFISELNKLRHTFSLSSVNNYLDGLLKTICLKTSAMQNNIAQEENMKHNKILSNSKKRVRSKDDDEDPGACSTSRKIKKQNIENVYFDTDVGSDLTDDSGFQNFKMPSLENLRNKLNETHVIQPSASSSDWNKTFEKTMSSSISNGLPVIDNNNETYVNNILSDGCVHLPLNKKLMRNGLKNRQDSRNVQQITIATQALRNRNKTFISNRVPTASQITKVQTEAVVTKAKHQNSSNGVSVPIVKMNRATYIRTKK